MNPSHPLWELLRNLETRTFVLYPKLQGRILAIVHKPREPKGPKIQFRCSLRSPAVEERYRSSIRVPGACY